MVRDNIITFYFECDKSRVLRTIFERMRKKLLVVRTAKDQSEIMASFRQFKDFVVHNFNCFWRIIEVTDTEAQFGAY